MSSGIRVIILTVSPSFAFENAEYRELTEKLGSWPKGPNKQLRNRFRRGRNRLVNLLTIRGGTENADEDQLPLRLSEIFCFSALECLNNGTRRRSRGTISPVLGLRAGRGFRTLV